MRYGIPTTTTPDNPRALYMRNLYHVFFWGPFETEETLILAINHLDEVEPRWDYNPFCIIYGANPLPQDFVLGFPFVDQETLDRIHQARKQHG